MRPQQQTVVRSNRDYGIPASCVYINAMGQSINACDPNTASGYYLASNEAVKAMTDAGTNPCPNGTRPGRMVLKGLPETASTPGGYIGTCNGKIQQQDMPDVHIINWQYRIHMNVALAALVIIMVVVVTYKLFR
jgi:hypothetical protein